MRQLQIIGIIMLAVRVAAAQPDAAQAEVLFRQAQKLLAEGQVTEACAAFDASEKLDPTVATVLNQASCREKNDQIATAWGLFLEAERQSRSGTDAAATQMHKAAVAHASKVEQRLSTLTIVVPDSARVGGLEILRDKESVDPGAWSKALPIDGGTYKITARAPGNAEWTATVTVANERDAKTIEVPKLTSADLGVRKIDAPQTEASQEVDAPVASDEAALAREDTRATRLPYYVGAGALGVLGGSLAFELVAESTDEKSKVELDASKQLSQWHTANGERYAAEALLAAGVAGAGAAAWLYLRGRHDEEPVASRRRGMTMAPMVATDRMGIELLGGF